MGWWSWTSWCPRWCSLHSDSADAQESAQMEAGPHTSTLNMASGVQMKNEGWRSSSLNDWSVTINNPKWNLCWIPIHVATINLCYWLMYSLFFSANQLIIKIHDKLPSQYTNMVYLQSKTCPNPKTYLDPTFLELIPFRCIDSMRGRSSGWMQVSIDVPIRSWGRYPSNGTALWIRTVKLASSTYCHFIVQRKLWLCTCCVYRPVIHFQKHTARGVCGGEDALVHGDPRCCMNE